MILNKLNSSSNTIVNYLQKGGIIIIPTDTVYGFSGIVDVIDKPLQKTDDRIRSIKGRSETKPLIQLIAEPNDIFQYTNDSIPQILLDKWPGPLTIIVNVKESIRLAINQKTIAFRCPGDLWLRNIIKECHTPIYSTSVNRSGKPVLDKIEEIIKEFEQEVDLIINDGDKQGAIPSTIVTIENNKIKIIRQGAVII